MADTAAAHGAAANGSAATAVSEPRPQLAVEVEDGVAMGNGSAAAVAAVAAASAAAHGGKGGDTGTRACTTRTESDASKGHASRVSCASSVTATDDAPRTPTPKSLADKVAEREAVDVLRTPNSHATATTKPTPKTDRYGFFVAPARASDSLSGSPAPSGAGAGAGAGSATIRVSASIDTKQVKLENQRAQKWLDMMGHWNTFVSKKAAKLKSRIRKGVPDAVRGTVWRKLVGADTRQAANPELYSRLLHAPEAEHEEIFEVIERDIRRTFPTHFLFAESGGLGQSALCRVLRAYAVYDTKVGYCQGMGFITASFLSYMPEEDAFFLLLTVLQYAPHSLAELFCPAMPKLGQVQYVLQELVRRRLPKLAEHLRKQDIHPNIYAAQWVMTIFTYSFPFHLTVRIWDCFLWEGWKIVYRVGLALLKLAQDSLLKMSFEHMMTFLRDELPRKYTADKLLGTAFSLPLKRKEIEQHEADYEAAGFTTYTFAQEVAMADNSSKPKAKAAKKGK